MMRIRFGQTSWRWIYISSRWALRFQHGGWLFLSWTWLRTKYRARCNRLSDPECGVQCACVKPYGHDGAHVYDTEDLCAALDRRPQEITPAIVQEILETDDDVAEARKIMGLQP